MKIVTPTTLIIVAVAVSVIGFLFIHSVSLNLLLNIQMSDIWLTERCSNNSNDEWYCGAELPYRWLLAACVAVIAGAVIWDRVGQSRA
jgi:H+/Cl- antiporter ClcA